MQYSLLRGGLIAAVLLTAGTLSGCSSAEVDPESPFFTVRPGESIQAAVDAVEPGATIRIMAGVYAEAVRVEKAGLRIEGRPGPNGEPVIIENPGGAAHGFNVRPGSDQFSLSHVTLRGFDRNGVFISRVTGFSVQNVTAEDNGAYGIYPIFSSDGSVTDCRASGHADAGVYVGRSSAVRIERCVTHGNVIGIEISNSVDIEATDNVAFDNTVGILAVLIPGLAEVKVTEGILLRQNHVRDNNLANFADGGLASFVPRGSGILAIGLDDSVIEENLVTGNDFVGIALASSVMLGAIAGLPPEAFADIEPNPDRVTVRRNQVFGNGKTPVRLPLPLPAVDLLWDTSGSGNCWSDNTFTTRFPEPLPGCGTGARTL